MADPFQSKIEVVSHTSNRAWVVGWTLFGIGCADVILRLWSAHRLHAISTGIEDVVNNPGKHFYHLVIMPLVGAYLYSVYPRQALREVLRSTRGLFLSAMALAAGLFALTLYLVIAHEKHDFYSRCTTPEDVRDFSVRSNLFRLREDLKNQLPKKLGDAYQTNAINAFHAFEEARNQLFATNHISESWGGFLLDRSLRGKVASLETLVAVLIGSIVLWSGTVFFLGGILLRRSDLVSTKAIHAFLSVIAAGLLWAPLMMYSEWYYHFKTLEESSPAIQDALVWLAVGGLVFLGLLFSTKVIKWVYAGFGVLGGVLNYVFKSEPKLFSAMAEWFYTSPPFMKFSIYIAATFAAVIAILSVSRTVPRKKLKSPPAHSLNPS